MHDAFDSQVCARLLKVLADPERLRIVAFLRAGPRNVSELACLLKQPLANVSHHLGVLREAGMVRHHKDGKKVVYRLDPKVFRPAGAAQPADCLDLGCCRLELNG
jgi:DNA-binding transcriptional ArsR family regulator